MTDIDPARRTEEIEGYTNLFFIHPIARRLTGLLARLHVRPNAVSIAGMAAGIAAGVAYYRCQNPIFAVLGFALMIVWHVMDGADGQLARLTRTQSELGRILDGVCDYVTFTAVYIAFALQLSRQHGGLAWLLVLAAGIAHALQAAAYERQRQDYDHWGWGRDAPAAAPGPERIDGSLQRAYAQIQRVMSGPTRDRDRLDARLRDDAEAAATLRRHYRETFARPVRRWSILSANTRTIAIFLCALAKAPAAYFVFELVGLSVVLVVLSRRQRARLARFLTGSAPRTDTPPAASAAAGA